MEANNASPEELSERESFRKIIKTKRDLKSTTDLERRNALEERQAALLAEVGERLETLEAVKALVRVEHKQ